MNITHTVSLLELVWTICGLIGFYANSLQLVRARIIKNDLRTRHINSIRKYAANTTFLMFFTWTMVQLMFVIVGVSAMTQPSPHNKPTHVSIIFGVCFVAVSVFLSVASVIINRRREYLVSLFKDGHDLEPSTL